MKKNEAVKYIPLGGIGEIGKNMNILEFQNDIIIIDSGMSFPEDEMLGIDIVIPDMEYLVKNKKKIRGLLLTHGHEDHIGSVPFLLKEVGMIPIYGTKLTLGLLENKFKEHNLNDVDLKEVKHGERIPLGAFEGEFIRVTHSIPDSSSIAVRTPVGNVIFTGDFKVDYTPIDGEKMNLARFAELGDEGVIALFSDSTNATKEGYTGSESTVGVTFDHLFNTHNGRIIVATFASNIHRIQQIINSAEASGRKLVVSGRSMIQNIEVATNLGYLNIKKDTIIDLNDIDRYSDDKVAFILTGTQGEPMAALSRIAESRHNRISLHPNDLVILSATPIPGNEKTVSKVINNLIEKDIKVITDKTMDVHVSGHGSIEELKLILNLTNPEYFFPVHGEIGHLRAHAKIAENIGIKDENIFLLENGDSVLLGKEKVKLGDRIEAGRILVDGLGVGDVGNIVLRDRKHLSEDGIIIVVFTLDKKTGKVILGPDLISRGFVYVRESEDLLDEARDIVKDELDKCYKANITDWGELKYKVRNTLRNHLFTTIKRNPMILPIIMEI